jgi:general secretion pathway protein D
LRRVAYLPLFMIVAVFLAGCPKGNQDFNAGKKAEELQDYDTALADYQHALRTDPSNAEYKLRTLQMRFEDAQYHLEQGRNDLNKNELEMALAEFQRASTIDPSNSAAEEEVNKTLQLIAARSGAAVPKSPAASAPSIDSQLLSAPPELKPLSREPINFHATEDARTVFETIGKLAGLSVLFDPDFVSRRISVELPGVTLEQALDAVALESKAFWKPLTSSVIFVAPDNPQKRRDLEDEEVRTFYISNSLTPQDLTEVVTSLRQLLDLRRVTQVNADNAIVVRDTPDKLILAQKIIDSIDQARSEVLIHFQVLSASVDHLRDLGVLPGQSATIQFTPLTSNQPNGGSSSSSTTGTTTTSQITLGNLKNISLNDYSATLPGATATAILTDNKTRIIQDPEIRITDGEKASLKIGEKVPVATGSFQAGLGTTQVGAVSPLVNTQFQYLDVGVNIDVTPRVHPDGDVSLTLTLDVSSVISQENIGGIEQPILGQNKIGPDQIRLKPGEVSVLGGLFQTTNTTNKNGIPGLAQLPFFKYLFSDNSTEVQTNDILIVITPHVLRMPQITAADLRPMAAGSDTNVRVYYKDEEPQDGATPSALGSPIPNSTAQPATAAPSQSAAPGGSAAQLQFTPSSATIKAGQRLTLGLNVANVNDLYSIPLLIHYDPKVIQVEDVTNGGFLSGGNQEVAIVQRVDAQNGQVIVSATRQPNTPGVNGSGALLGLVIRAVAPGTSPIQILQVNARNSQQQTIPMVSGEATINVQ